MYELRNIQRTTYFLFTTMYQCYVKCTTLYFYLVDRLSHCLKNRALGGTKTRTNQRAFVEQFRAFFIVPSTAEGETPRERTRLRFSDSFGR